MISLISLILSSIIATSLASQINLAPISFKEIAVPEGEDVKKYHGFTEVTISGVTYNVSYTPLLESGKSYPSFTAGQQWEAGTVLDINGKVITKQMDPDADPALARDFDRTSLFTRFGKIWAFTQNEDLYGSLYLMELSQSATGILSIIRAKTVSLSDSFGSVRPCSGSLTPWKTHLLAEEFVAETKNFPPNSDIGLSKLGNVHGIQWNETNPYWIGFMIEASVTNARGSTTTRKRFSMGRIAWETAIVLPDRKTVLGTDDISSGGVLLMFIADKAGDLRKGRLYAAAVKQIYSEADGAFTINWIHLNPDGKSVHENDIKKYINGKTFQDSKVTFDSLFEVATVQYLDVNKTMIDYSKMPEGFKTVKTEGTKIEWLKLKSGMGAIASRLETRRMAAYMGATNEFTKIEGLTYDAYTKSVYMASTAIQRSMTDSPMTFDLGGPNQIRLPVNTPGAVYKLTLNEKYQPKLIDAVVSSFGYNKSATINSVPHTSIASPDNVGFMAKYSTLLISEDCDTQHLNNYLWAYNTLTGKLTRIFASSIDAEATGGYYFPNIGKFSYLTATVQHPAEGVSSTVGYWVLPAEDSVYVDHTF